MTSSSWASDSGRSVQAWGEDSCLETDERVFYNVLETADLRACRLEDKALQVRLQFHQETFSEFA